MNYDFFKRKAKLAHLLIYYTFFIGSVFAGSKGQFTSYFKPPETPPGAVSLFEGNYPGLSRFFVDSTLFTSRFSRFVRRVSLDSTQQYVDIQEKLYGKDYRLPVRMSLDYYIKRRMDWDRKQQWNRTVLKFLERQLKLTSSGIELNIPVRIKSKAFKRIFGGDRVGLRVTGNISFELAGRTEDRSGSAVSSFEQRNTFSPKFKQTQQFRVEGRVGDKVSVSVDQNSEATFDFENTLRLIYDGDEDEIVQKIEAGNVSLSLPATHYVSTSSKHQGLFGLKTQMRVGNLAFTGVASLERGEKQKITQTGSASENTHRIKDYEYVRNKFFFVDSVYMAHFEDFNKLVVWEQDPAVKRIVQLDVWVSTSYSDQDGLDGYAVLYPEKYTNQDSIQEIQGVVEKGKFKRLEYPKDYEYDELRGYFWLKRPINDQDIVAIAYRTEDGFQRGMLFNEINDSTQTLILKLVKPRVSKPEFKSTWQLMMKNVYNLGAANIPIEGFNLKVLYTADGQDQDVQPVEPRETFNFLMGLDRRNEQGAFVQGGDKEIDVRNPWIFDLGNGYLIFPSLTPFAPDNPQFAIDSSLYVNIYNIKDRTLERTRSKFEIEVTTSTVSTTYNLGFNVLEGSETVRLNGRTLVKDKDYTIDYFSGTLQLLTEDARRADAQVEIEYEKGSLFQLDKKSFLGGRLEYQLGNNNFLGLTALYFNQTTLDQRIRIGQEPIRNFVWDVNTALSFKPNFLTRFLDKLPIVETSAESNLKVEAEYAQVNPNPNTFNEPKIGDNGGVAYIDDFEGSKRFTSLGIIYRIWSYASIPVRFRILKRPYVDYTVNELSFQEMSRIDRYRVRLNWYNPFNQVPIKEIWPEKDVNTQTGTTTNVLVLRWKNSNVSPDSAWAGIMRSTISFPDQQKTKYISLWIKGDVGQVNIDIGRISEDWWIRGKNYEGKPSFRNLNTEDVNTNGLLEDDEDTGIDGIPDGQPGDDPDDNWAPPDATNPPYWNINGTEGNGDKNKGAQGARYPDTEDLDGDSNLNLFNEYFEYSFDLSESTSPFFQGATKTGWRLFKIPLKDFNFKIGNPDSSFQEIFFVRLWLNNLPKDDSLHQIQIATFDFEGNEWEEVGVKEKDSKKFTLNDDWFTVSVYNTEENAVEIAGGPEKYHSPPGVTGIRDRITKALSKEQSLVLQLHHLPAGAVAEVKKQLFESMNLLHYRKLKMFVHGDRNLTDQDSLEFYIRFGSTPDTYYEFGERVYPHWDKRNEIVLDFDELTRTKLDEYLTADSIGTRPIHFRRDSNNPEKYYKVVGTPGLHNIRYFILGARNKSGHDLDNMEIWVDEMRVTDVERDKGTAMRLKTDLTMADVGRISAQWEVVDDNFRRLEQKFSSANGKDVTRERQSYFLDFKMGKFFPANWGIKIPISARFTRSRNIPKFFYNTDRRTHYKISGLGERLQTFFGLRKLSPDLEANSTINEVRSVGTTIKRAGKPRDPWFLKYTLNAMQFDVDFSNKHSSNPNILYNNSRAFSGRFNYAISFGNKNFIRPFAWLGKMRFLKPLTSQKLFLTPTNFSFNFSLNDKEDASKNRLQQNEIKKITANSVRRLSLGYKMFESLSFNWGRDYQSDGFYKGYRAKDILKNMFTNLDFGLDRNVSQRFSITHNPRLTQWLNYTFRYSSNFVYSVDDPEINARRASLNKNRQFNISLKPSILANQIYNPKRAQLKRKTRQRTQAPAPIRGRPRRRGQPPPAPKKNPLENPEEANLSKISKFKKSQQDSTQKQPGKEGGKEVKTKPHRPPIKIPNPAILVWKFFNAWKSFQTNIQFQDNLTHFNIDDFPVLKYQLGLTDDPGVGTDTSFRKIPVLPTIRHRKQISSNLNFNFARNLITNFQYKYNKMDNQSNQNRTATISSSYFFVGDDPEANRKAILKYVPDWTVRINGLEKIGPLSKIATSVSLEHSRSGKYSESARFENNQKIRDQWNYTNSFQPLLGINISTKWKVNGGIRFSKNSTFNYNRTGAITKNLQSSFNMNFSYSTSKGFRIPLPFFKHKRIKNEMQFSLVVDRTDSRSFAKRPGETKFQEMEVNKSFKFRPSVTYRFSQKVNGTAYFESGSTENKRTGKYSYFEFGINVNIAIR